MPLLLLTGATGLLGRAVAAEFRRPPKSSSSTTTPNGGAATAAPELHWRAVGIGRTRVPPAADHHASDASAAFRLAAVDLCDAAAVARLVARERPDVLIHVAAERRPDTCERRSFLPAFLLACLLPSS